MHIYPNQVDFWPGDPPQTRSAHGEHRHSVAFAHDLQAGNNEFIHFMYIYIQIKLIFNLVTHCRLAVLTVSTATPWLLLTTSRPEIIDWFCIGTCFVMSIICFILCLLLYLLYCFVLCLCDYRVFICFVIYICMFHIGTYIYIKTKIMFWPGDPPQTRSAHCETPLRGGSHTSHSSIDKSRCVNWQIQVCQLTN